MQVISLFLITLSLSFSLSLSLSLSLARPSLSLSLSVPPLSLPVSVSLPPPPLSPCVCLSAPLSPSPPLSLAVVVALVAAGHLAIFTDWGRSGGPVQAIPDWQMAHRHIQEYRKVCSSDSAVTSTPASFAVFHVYHEHFAFE